MGGIYFLLDFKLFEKKKEEGGEQYKYKYFTYSHYHSKLLKPERFLLVSLYVFTRQNSYTFTTGRKPDLSSSSSSSLTINNITHYSHDTGYTPPVTSSPTDPPSEILISCLCSQVRLATPRRFFNHTNTDSSDAFCINKYYSNIKISVRFSKHSPSRLRC